MLRYRHKLGPSYTLKERIYIGLAFGGAFLAAFGAVAIGHGFIDDTPRDHTLSFFVGVIVFFGTLALMAIGIEHIRQQRMEHEIKELFWSREIDERVKNEQL